MSRVIIFSPDTVPVGRKLAAGPGIRSYEMAAALSKTYHEVTLASPEEDFTYDELSPVKLVSWNAKNVGQHCRGKDVVILPQGRMDLARSYVAQVGADVPTVVDLYDPVLLENLYNLSANQFGINYYQKLIKTTETLLRRGDFFIVANERQRFYYLGMLNMLGRINPRTRDARLMGIVPFGVPSEEPVHSKTALKGVIVPEGAKVILWSGGIYPWFDPFTLMKAMKILAAKIPDVKLVIQGGVHPRLHAPDSTYRAALRMAKELSLLGDTVVEIPWVPLNECFNYFLESDLGVCIHEQNLENELSFRTRVLAFLRAGLPVVVSRGDVLSLEIQKFECGKVVSPGDEKELAVAMAEILEDEEKRGRMSYNAKEFVLREYAWEKVIRPLEKFCSEPRLADDRLSHHGFGLRRLASGLRG